DQKLIQRDNPPSGGKEIMEHIKNYREGVIDALPGGKFNSVKEAVNIRSATSDGKKDDGKVEKRDGSRQDWINYHYEGFPLVASLTKLTQLQADIKTTEQEVLKNLLEGELTEAVSLTNFASALSAPKTAYYAGEKYNGKIIV